MMFSSSSRLNGIGSGLHDEGQDPTATWWEQEWTAEGSGGRGNRRQQEPSESARVDALETLVRQLIEQNEHLRNEMAEGRSRSSSDLADQGLRGFLRSGISSIHLLALRRGTPKVRSPLPKGPSKALRNVVYDEQALSIIIRNVSCVSLSPHIANLPAWRPERAGRIASRPHYMPCLPTIRRLAL